MMQVLVAEIQLEIKSQDGVLSFFKTHRTFEHHLANSLCLFEICIIVSQFSNEVVLY